jgi:hypothetical protein
MIARFANVVYWAASAIAVLFLIGAATAIINNKGDSVALGIVLGIAGILAWLAGRAVLYVLAGR